jgi:zinc protease
MAPVASAALRSSREPSGLPRSGGLRAERLDLPNGLRLLHNRAPSNPSVVVRALVRAAASRESSAAEHGLAALTGRMLRQGTEHIAKEALAEELDGMGAGLSVDVGYATVAASIKCLAADIGRASEILAEVLRRPTFSADELERVRGQVLTDLKEMDDNTRVVAERAWREQAYPAEHRYHALPTGRRETVESFTRDDMERFFRAWYGPNQTTLVVVGDVGLEQTAALAERAFGDWRPARPDPLPPTLPSTPMPAAGEARVAMAGKTQADVVLGTPTLDRAAPDYYALSFGNHVLGRLYFMGRFGEKVRDEQGLAYYAYSELQAGFGRGPWVVRAGVNPANLERALASIRAELERFCADGPTEDEQRDGASSLIGGLPRQLETNEGMAAVLGEIDLFDLGLDYLARYPAIIQSLTREQVTAAARTWLAPAHLVTAIAGP